MQGKNSKKRYMISISTITAYFMFVNYSLKRVFVSQVKKVSKGLQNVKSCIFEVFQNVNSIRIQVRQSTFSSSAGQVRLGQNRSLSVRSGHFRIGQLRSLQVRLLLIRSGQSTSNQVRLGQIESAWFRPDQVSFRPAIDLGCCSPLMRVDQISQTGVAFEEAHKHVGGGGHLVSSMIKIQWT